MPVSQLSLLPRGAKFCCHGIRRELEQLLEECFEIEHTTLQVDHAQTAILIQIGQTPATRHQHY